MPRSSMLVARTVYSGAATGRGASVTEGTDSDAPPLSTASTTVTKWSTSMSEPRQVVATDPSRGHLGRELRIPSVRELRLRVAFTTGAVAHDDAREPDVRVLGTPGLHQLVERGLAHRVRAESGPRRCEGRADGRQVRRGARGRGERRQRRARDERGAGDVRLEHAPPRVRVRVDEPGQRPDARCVHERVDPAEAGRSVRDRRSAGRLIGDVTLDHERVRPRLLRRGFEQVAPPRQQRHAGTPLREADPDAPPETAGRADDDGSHVVLLLRLLEMRTRRQPAARKSRSRGSVATFGASRVSRGGRAGRTPTSPRQ